MVTIIKIEDQADREILLSLITGLDNPLTGNWVQIKIENEVYDVNKTELKNLLEVLNKDE